VLVVNGNPAGHVEMVVDLSTACAGPCAVGTNGILIIKAADSDAGEAGHPAAPGSTVVKDPQLLTTALPTDDIAILLVQGPTLIAELSTLTADAGMPELPAEDILVDSVGWKKVGSFVFGGIVLSQNSGTPDAATRFPGRFDTSVSAWYNGDILGATPDGLPYDIAKISSNFPTGGTLTPGAPNFPQDVDAGADGAGDATSGDNDGSDDASDANDAASDGPVDASGQDAVSEASGGDVGAADAPNDASASDGSPSEGSASDAPVSDASSTPDGATADATSDAASGDASGADAVGSNDSTGAVDSAVESDAIGTMDVTFVDANGEGGGAGGMAGSGGRGTAGAAGTTPLSVNAPADAGDTGGCGCRTATHPARPGGFGFGLLAVTALSRLRRRKNRLLP
jgi:MYXO-CTERM domain-containing protein